VSEGAATAAATEGLLLDSPAAGADVLLPLASLFVAAAAAAAAAAEGGGTAGAVLELVAVAGAGGDAVMELFICALALASFEVKLPPEAGAGGGVSTVVEVVDGVAVTGGAGGSAPAGPKAAVEDPEGGAAGAGAGVTLSSFLKRAVTFFTEAPDPVLEPELELVVVEVCFFLSGDSPAFLPALAPAPAPAPAAPVSVEVCPPLDALLGDVFEAGADAGVGTFSGAGATTAGAVALTGGAGAAEGAGCCCRDRFKIPVTFFMSGAGAGAEGTRASFMSLDSLSLATAAADSLLFFPFGAGSWPLVC
jgi:hypothetical protein